MKNTEALAVIDTARKNAKKAYCMLIDNIIESGFDEGEFTNPVELDSKGLSVLITLVRNKLLFQDANQFYRHVSYDDIIRKYQSLLNPEAAAFAKYTAQLFYLTDAHDSGVVPEFAQAYEMVMRNLLIECYMPVINSIIQDIRDPKRPVQKYLHERCDEAIEKAKRKSEVAKALGQQLDSGWYSDNIGGAV